MHFHSPYESYEGWVQTKQASSSLPICGPPGLDEMKPGCIHLARFNRWISLSYGRTDGGMKGNRIGALPISRSGSMRSTKIMEPPEVVQSEPREPYNLFRRDLTNGKRKLREGGEQYSTVAEAFDSDGSNGLGETRVYLNQ
jgi:hypothetical protein